MDDDSDWVVVDKIETKKSRLYKTGLKLSVTAIRWYFYNNWKVNAIIMSIKTILYLRKMNISKEILIGYLAAFIAASQNG